jgi:putative transposase
LNAGLSTISRGGWDVFFTANLLERYPNDLLVQQVGLLRTAVRAVEGRWPFYIDDV